MADCKWNQDEICVNADCPMVADYCPVPNVEGVCRYEDRCNGWQLYEKNWSDGRREYRYGPEWVAMQLYMEGGYPTPEEAKAAWLREWEAQK